MVRFEAFIPINVTSLSEFLIFNGTHPNASPTEITVQSGNVKIDIKGQFAPGLHGPTGVVNSIEVDKNSSVAYKFTGLSADVSVLAADIAHGHLRAAFNYLTFGNDKIVDSNGGPSVLAGGKGDDTFIFHAGFGQVEILDFNTGTKAHHDTINLHSVPGLDNFHDLKTMHAAVVAGHVVITDTMGDSISLDHVTSLNQIHKYDFHFA